MRHHRIIGILKIGLLGMLAFSQLGFAQSKTANPPAEQAKSQQKKETKKANTVNINQADSQRLQTLPRIGPSIAQRIIEFREQHGPFKTLEELMNVRGIGEKTFLRLKPLISI